jgi:hypothetical protein
MVTDALVEVEEELVDVVLLLVEDLEELVEVEEELVDVVLLVEDFEELVEVEEVEEEVVDVVLLVEELEEEDEEEPVAEVEDALLLLLLLWVVDEAADVLVGAVDEVDASVVLEVFAEDPIETPYATATTNTTTIIAAATYLVAIPGLARECQFILLTLHPPNYR